MSGGAAASSAFAARPQVQSIKQNNSMLKHSLTEGVDGVRPVEVSLVGPPPPPLSSTCDLNPSPGLLPPPQPAPKMNSRWTTDEQLLAVQGE